MRIWACSILLGNASETCSRMLYTEIWLFFYHQEGSLIINSANGSYQIDTSKTSSGKCKKNNLFSSSFQWHICLLAKSTKNPCRTVLENAEAPFPQARNNGKLPDSAICKTYRLANKFCRLDMIYGAFQLRSNAWLVFKALFNLCFFGFFLNHENI